MIVATGELRYADLTKTLGGSQSRAGMMSLRSAAFEESVIEVREKVRRLGPWATAVRLQGGFNAEPR